MSRPRGSYAILERFFWPFRPFVVQIMDDPLSPPPASVTWTEDGQIESPWVKAWRDIVEVSPEIARLARRFQHNNRPPNPMSDMLFVALVATLADPLKREILRAQILDLLTPDLVALLKGFLFEEKE